MDLPGEEALVEQPSLVDHVAGDAQPSIMNQNQDGNQAALPAGLEVL